MISVIIPVYNVENYLKDCVESVLNQSYKNYEVILVDDGSTDKSGEICDSFQNEKIKVIHKVNGGLSDARNVGTATAEGEYITWLDSDDTIHKDFLKILLELIEASDADMSVGELLVYKENTVVKYPDGNFQSNIYNGMEALKRMLQGELHGTSACGLLIKSELAKRYPFPYKKYHEDDFTTYKFYIDANRVAYTNQPLYFYLQRQGSIMHKPFGKIDIDELNAADDIYIACEKLGEDFKKASLVKKTGNYCQIFFKYDNLKVLDKETFDRINEFFNSYMRDILRNKYISRKKKIKIIICKIGLLKFVRAIWGKKDA